MGKEFIDTSEILLIKKKAEAFDAIVGYLFADPDNLDWNMETLQEVTEIVAHVVPLTTCAFCGRAILFSTAHYHDGDLIGDCCWDERLRASE